MAWIFLPGGLLMPADTPMDEANPHFTRGYRDLQVRARVKSHLENFIFEYMEPLGLDYSDIEMTPDMDYDARFYTRRSDFALAIGQAMMDIDYHKFKPTAERKDSKGNLLYKDGKEYHSVLNSIWGTVARLGNPYGGRSWGTGSWTAPKGKSSAATVTSSGYTPSTFGKVERVTPPRPSAAALAQAGVADPEGVLRQWEKQDREEEAAIAAAEAMEGLSAEEMETMSDEEIAAYIWEGDFDEDILDDSPEEAAMALVPDEEVERSFERSQYKTAEQIMLIAKHLPMGEWGKVFDKDEIDYLMTRSMEVDSVTGEVLPDEEPQTLSKAEVKEAVRKIQAHDSVQQ
jgi:hypothetical protein